LRGDGKGKEEMEEEEKSSPRRKLVVLEKEWDGNIMRVCKNEKAKKEEDKEVKQRNEEIVYTSKFSLDCILK